jgi:hypothetical protein
VSSVPDQMQYVEVVLHSCYNDCVLIICLYNDAVSI